jgi:GGDEF domain-containing protein
MLSPRLIWALVVLTMHGMKSAIYANDLYRLLALSLADLELYSAKLAGRNRVEAASNP